jgi:hypothetical protein
MFKHQELAMEHGLVSTMGEIDRMVEKLRAALMSAQLQGNPLTSSP